MFSDCDYQEKKMNYCVPDFETDDDCSLLSSSVLSNLKITSRQEHDVIELLWKNGQVLMQDKTQKSMKKSPSSSSLKFENSITADQITIKDNRPFNQEEEEPELFMQEDEMALWLQYQYSLYDDPSLNPNLCSELFYQPPPQLQLQPQPQPQKYMDINQNAAVMAMLPLPPVRGMEEMMMVNDFGIFSNQKWRDESGPSKLKEQTVGESNGELGDGGGGVTVGEITTSTGYSSVGMEMAMTKMTVDTRKRKGKEKETDDNECHNPDVEFESTDPKKQVCGSTSTKRSRAAEVHNLSERRRRDRINEKMKSLQELIPRCNKVDKASMLDEAIEYLRALRMQVQIMSMGFSMVPMMYPGVQQFMPQPMGMGLGMGMGMAMDMNMNLPMMPYPNMLAGSTFPMPAGAAHFGPSFSFPPFPMSHVPNTDPSRFQATNQSDYMHSSPGTQNTNQPMGPTSLDAYQQFLGFQQMQVLAAGSQPAPQNQQAAPPGTSNQCTGFGWGLDSINHYLSG